jgi:AcrR family transcriptional regulator
MSNPDRVPAGSILEVDNADIASRCLLCQFASMASPSFHHGNLRAELISLAELEIESCGHAELSIRDLASKLGVSRAAPYRHFENRAALLVALAERGLERLRESYAAARMRGSCPAERLRLACRSYLDFASRQPEMFRLVFAGATLPVPVKQGDDSAFGIFEALVGEARTLSDPVERRTAALVCWSTIHGCAMLRLDQRLSRLAKVEEVEEAVLQAVV